MSPSGGTFRFLLLRNVLVRTCRIAAKENPREGRHQERHAVASLLSPLRFVFREAPPVMALAVPAPMSEPVGVCELDAGRPRFHKIGARKCGEHHCRPTVRVNGCHKFYRQQMHDGIWHGESISVHAQEIESVRKDHRAGSVLWTLCR